MEKILESQTQVLEVVDKNDRCWWCQVNEASTGEHKYKRTDFKKMFSDLDDVVVIHDKKSKDVQGPNSKYLKFSKNLCYDCNNKRSRQMDIAYSKFFNYAIDNYKSIINTKVLCFEDIFDTNWFENKKQVFRYLVKHVCSRLHSNRTSIPRSYIEYLNDNGTLKEIGFRLTYNEPAITFANTGEAFLGVSPLNMDIMEDMKINYAISSYNFGVFKFQYLCSAGFHEGQHYDYNEYLEHSCIRVYEDADYLTTRNIMSRQEYFAKELAFLK